MPTPTSVSATATELSVPPARRAGIWQAWLVILLGQLPVMAIVSLMPALPTLAQHFAGVPHGELLIPMILTVPGIGIGLIAPFAGYLVDKFGRRKLLLPFLVLYGIGGVLPFFLDGFGTVMAGRLLLGVGECFVLVVGNTLLGDYFTPEQRPKWLTIQGVFGPATAIGLLALSGHLAAIGWNYPFLVYGLALIVAALAWRFIFEPTRPTALADENAPVVAAAQFPLREVTLVFSATLLISLLYYVHIVHFSLALDEMGIRDKVALGNISAVAGIGVPVGALLYRLLVKRLFWQQLALIGLLFGLGLLGIGTAHDQTMATTAGFLEQVGSGMTIPVLVSWALRTLPVAFRGRGMGFWTSAFFLGQFFNPFLLVGTRSLVGGSLLAAFRTLGWSCLGLAGIVLIGALLASRPRLAVSERA